MLFKDEATGDHFMWNGTYSISVKTADPHTLIGEATPTEAQLLNEAAATPRKRTLVLRKRRYNVIAKGEFQDV